MKTPRLFFALVLMAGGMVLPPAHAEEPEGGEAARRQDFTGQGTYHRQGMLREQGRAVRSEAKATAKASPSATATPSPSPIPPASAKSTTPNFWQKIWQHFFPPKTTR